MRALAVSMALLGAAGCSLLLDTAEPTQCATDSDCEANPVFRNRICSAGFCVVPTANPVPVSPAVKGCVSTELCTQANSGQAAVCKTAGGPCVVWETEQCRFIEGAWADPNAIVIGDLQPFTVKQQDLTRVPILYADRVRKSIDLALNEFSAEQPGGFTFPDGRIRPFAVFHCDSGLDEEESRAAMRHLTEVVGVQAMIVGADDDLASITTLAAQKQTAIACSDCIGPFPEGPLAWRIVPPISLEAPMAAWRVADLESQIKATNPAAIKVAIILVPGRATEAFVTALVEKLRFNDKSAIDNGDRFLLIKTEDASIASVNQVKHADDLRAFEPDIIIAAMTIDLPTYYMPLVEGGWSSTKHRPYYITTNLNRNVESFAGVIDNDDLRKRISGTRPGYSPELEQNLAGFTQRYIQAYSFNRPDNAESGYDAFYALAFAILGARLQPVLDGPHISTGFERLRGGTTVTDFKPESIAFATALLGQATAKLDVRATISDLDWNLPGRDIDQDVSMYCYERHKDGYVVINPNAGPHLASKTGVVTGTYDCK
jgi:hypothetical protein